MQMNKVGQDNSQSPDPESLQKKPRLMLTLGRTWVWRLHDWVPLLTANCRSTEKTQKIPESQDSLLWWKAIFNDLKFNVFRNCYLLFLWYYAYKAHLNHVKDYWAHSVILWLNNHNSWQCEEFSRLKRLVKILWNEWVNWTMITILHHSLKQSSIL